jgi:Holliday junction resolvase
LKRAAKVDRNQPEVVKALRDRGASVQPLHGVHGGVPDLLVGFRGRNYMIEVKDGSKGSLTQRQVEWHDDWAGQVVTVTSVAEACDIVFVDLY